MPYSKMPSDIYHPAEDSYFLTRILKQEIPKLLQENPDLMFLEIGTGSGIHLETAFNSGIKKENIFSCDINANAVSHCTSLGFHCIYSDLFEKILGKFDIIVFNPPYLAEDKHDKNPDTSAGKKGDETILKFLIQAKNHLNENGRIFLLLSSLTPLDNIERQIKHLNYNKKFLGNEKLFYEELYVWELSAKD